jgi:lauroyl/myristoyl acyltransferase
MIRPAGERHPVLWRLAAAAHAFDYAVALPALARLPLPLGYALASLRGRANGLARRDWRSMALGFRHVGAQTAAGYRMFAAAGDGPGGDAQVAALVRRRFQTESREEFEGRLVAAGRVPRLRCRVAPEAFVDGCRDRSSGLVLLTPHFDSFILGVAFLGLAGVRVNLMSSSITEHPRVARAVSRHFADKYRALQRWMNGGRVVNREEGLRPFFRMLEDREAVVILADAPATPGGAAMAVDFLGRRCAMAAGALRMAQRTGSRIGGFVCRFVAPGRYELDGGPIRDARDPGAVQAVYDFLSSAILADPGRWWAADLLPAMCAAPDGAGTAGTAGAAGAAAVQA